MKSKTSLHRAGFVVESGRRDSATFLKREYRHLLYHYADPVKRRRGILSAGGFGDIIKGQYRRDNAAPNKPCNVDRRKSGDVAEFEKTR